MIVGCALGGIREKTAFANDLFNVTLASPRINRREKVDNDAAQWLPEFNQCWYAHRVVDVRRKYHLTVDEREVLALDAVFLSCKPDRMIYTPK